MVKQSGLLLVVMATVLKFVTLHLAFKHSYIYLFYLFLVVRFGFLFGFIAVCTVVNVCY